MNVLRFINRSLARSQALDPWRHKVRAPPSGLDKFFTEEQKLALHRFSQTQQLEQLRRKARENTGTTSLLDMDDGDEDSEDVSNVLMAAYKAECAQWEIKRTRKIQAEEELISVSLFLDVRARTRRARVLDMLAMVPLIRFAHTEFANLLAATMNMRCSACFGCWGCPCIQKLSAFPDRCFGSGCVRPEMRPPPTMNRHL